ncbi:hypothetical protein KAR91_12270 [Candidatus Pacearchaeota archaeon]|nr:hypothetical protein [Candidatus Pacearchaeota archaeon]
MSNKNDEKYILKRLLYESFFKKCVTILDDENSITPKLDRIKSEIAVTKRLFNYTQY